jgi:hypothetical protein
MKIILTQADMQKAFAVYLREQGLENLHDHQVVIEGSDGVDFTVDFGSIGPQVRTPAKKAVPTATKQDAPVDVTDPGKITIPESAKSPKPGAEVTVDDNGDGPATPPETSPFAPSQTEVLPPEPVTTETPNLFSPPATDTEVIEPPETTEDTVGLFGGAGAVTDNAADQGTVASLLNEVSGGDVKEQKSEDVKLFG